MAKITTQFIIRVDPVLWRQFEQIVPSRKRNATMETLVKEFVDGKRKSKA